MRCNDSKKKLSWKIISSKFLSHSCHHDKLKDFHRTIHVTMLNWKIFIELWDVMIAKKNVMENHLIKILITFMSPNVMKNITIEHGHHEIWWHLVTYDMVIFRDKTMSFIMMCHDMSRQIMKCSPSYEYLPYMNTFHAWRGSSPCENLPHVPYIVVFIICSPLPSRLSIVIVFLICKFNAYQWPQWLLFSTICECS